MYVFWWGQARPPSRDGGRWEALLGLFFIDGNFFCLNPKGETKRGADKDAYLVIPIKEF